MTIHLARTLACAFLVFTLLYHSGVGAQTITPTVSIAVSRVMVTQNVEVGRNYVLESSFDMVHGRSLHPHSLPKPSASKQSSWWM